MSQSDSRRRLVSQSARELGASKSIGSGSI